MTYPFPRNFGHDPGQLRGNRKRNNSNRLKLKFFHTHFAYTNCQIFQRGRSRGPPIGRPFCYCSFSWNPRCRRIGCWRYSWCSCWKVGKWTWALLDLTFSAMTIFSWLAEWVRNFDPENRCPSTNHHHSPMLRFWHWHPQIDFWMWEDLIDRRLGLRHDQSWANRQLLTAWRNESFAPSNPFRFPIVSWQLETDPLLKTCLSFWPVITIMIRLM